MAKNQYRIAVVGATTLLGKEVGDEIAESPLATAVTVLLDTEEANGTLETMGEEAAFIQTLEPAALENVDVAIFADARMLREHGRTARQFGAAVVDATGSANEDEGGPVHSPLAGGAITLGFETVALRAAHPVATMLSLTLRRIGSAAPIRSAAATVLQPASENGRAALEELQQQTVNLLSFQSVPTDQFDAQIAFNLLPALGESAQSSIASQEERILSDLQQLSHATVPAPSLQLIQTPVFHGYAVSLFVELERETTAEALAEALACESIDLVSEEGDPPSNLSAAGQGQILMQVRPTADGRRFTLWMVADNLKLRARTAVACALELTRLRPLGIVQ